MVRLPNLYAKPLGGMASERYIQIFRVFYGVAGADHSARLILSNRTSHSFCRLIVNSGIRPHALKRVSIGASDQAFSDRVGRW